MKFEQFELDPRLMAGIKRAGYEMPTPIQEAAIPAALRGRDLIGTAQTGTGKTAAFVLPILHKLLSGRRGTAQALIVTPTRELAEQIHEVIRALAVGTGIRSATIYGGVGPAPQVKALRDGTEILVACPGRLLDLMNQRLARLEQIQILVLDEADRMFDMGFLPDVKRIIKAVPTQRQTMLFAATFPAAVEQLAAQTLRQPQRISMGLSRPARTVTHALYPVPAHLKTALLLRLLDQTETDSVLIFTRTKYRAQKLAQQLQRAGLKVTSLHSNRTQGQRQSALQGMLKPPRVSKCRNSKRPNRQQADGPTERRAEAISVVAARGGCGRSSLASARDARGGRRARASRVPLLAARPRHSQSRG